MFMPENYVNVLFQKGLVLDDIIQLLNIEKINLCKQIDCNKEKVKVMPLYVLTDYNGKDYFI